MTEDELPSWERSALDNLQLHWGEVYDITHRLGEAWMATRPGSAPLVAYTPEGLLVLIRHDDFERRQP